MIYIDLDASVMRLLKRNSSPADLMHSPISKSDHSGGGTFDDLCDSIFSLSIILQLMMISIFFPFAFSTFQF